MPRDSSIQSSDRLGLLLAVGASVGLGLAVAVSQFAYQGGSNGLTVACARALLFVPMLIVFCRLTGRSLQVPRADLLPLAGLGVLMALAFYGNVGAVEYISIGLTAILFFTFPPLIAVFESILSRRLPSLGKCAALVTAFVGLTVMLGVSADEVDMTGVLLALGAAFAVATNTVWIARRFRHLDGVVASLYMGVFAALVLMSVLAVSGGLAVPTMTVGWVGLFSVACLQTLGLPMYYLAIPRVGALKVGMFANVQPVVSIMAALVLFGEVMTVTEFVGAAMVLSGIWIMQRSDRVRHIRTDVG